MKMDNWLYLNNSRRSKLKTSVPQEVEAKNAKHVKLVLVLAVSGLVADAELVAAAVHIYHSNSIRGKIGEVMESIKYFCTKLYI